MSESVTLVEVHADVAVQRATDEAPDYSPVDDEPNPVPEPASDETVIGVDLELAGTLAQNGIGLGGLGLGTGLIAGWAGAGGIAGLAHVEHQNLVGLGLAGASAQGLTATRFVPGYGLAALSGNSTFRGAGITALGIGGASPTGALPEGDLGSSEVNTASVQAAWKKYELELAERRIRISGLAVEGLEQSLAIADMKLTGHAAVGFDVLQMTLGGASFAHALQKEGMTPGAALAGVGFAADALTVAAHAIPGLKAIVPYANAASFVVKVIKEVRRDRPQFEAPGHFTSSRDPASGSTSDDEGYRRIDFIMR